VTRWDEGRNTRNVTAAVTELHHSRGESDIRKERLSSKVKAFNTFTQKDYISDLILVTSADSNSMFLTKGSGSGELLLVLASIFSLGFGYRWEP
jgi:hypothetical protein